MNGGLVRDVGEGTGTVWGSHLLISEEVPGGFKTFDACSAWNLLVLRNGLGCLSKCDQGPELFRFLRRKPGET